MYLRTNAMKTIKYILIIAVSGGVGCFAYMKWNALRDFLTPSLEVSETKIDNTANRIKEIKNIGEWEFLAVDCEVIVEKKRKRSFLVHDDYLVRIYKGCVRIGVDIKNAGDDWLTTEGDSVVYVNLPMPHVLDDRFIDEANTEVFYESGKWSGEEKEEMYEEAKGKMLKLVSEENYGEAREQARLRFTSLFKAVGCDKVIVNFYPKNKEG